MTKRSIPTCLAPWPSHLPRVHFPGEASAAQIRSGVFKRHVFCCCYHDAHSHTSARCRLVGERGTHVESTANILTKRVSEETEDAEATLESYDSGPKPDPTSGSGSGIVAESLSRDPPGTVEDSHIRLVRAGVGPPGPGEHFQIRHVEAYADRQSEMVPHLGLTVRMRRRALSENGPRARGARLRLSRAGYESLPRSRAGPASGSFSPGTEQVLEQAGCRPCCEVIGPGR